MTPRRVLHYSLMALLVTSAFYTLIIVAGRAPFDAFGNPVGVDFSAHVTGGRIAHDGDIAHLYDVNRQIEVQRRLLGGGHRELLDLFVSPPFVAYLWLPFAALPYLASALLWAIISASLLVLSLWLLRPLVPRLAGHGFGTLLLVALSTQAVIELLADGQDSAISLLLMVVGLRLLLTRRDLAAGAILGLGVFKPQLFLAMPLLFLLQRRWRALGSWLAISSALSVLSIALVGFNGVRAYLRLLTSDVYMKGIAEPLAWKMESLAGFSRSVLPESVAAVALPIAGLAFLPFLAMFLRVASKPAEDRRDFVLLYGLTLLLTAAGDPHFFVYDCVILLIPAVVLLEELPDNPAVRLSLAAIYLLTWTAAARHIVFGAILWPVSMLAAPWATAPILVLFLVARRELRSGAHDDPRHAGSVFHGIGSPQKRRQALLLLQRGHSLAAGLADVSVGRPVLVGMRRELAWRWGDVRLLAAVRGRPGLGFLLCGHGPPPWYRNTSPLLRLCRGQV